MKRFLILVILFATSSGCTVLNLRRHAVNQSLSVVDMRYQQVVDNLAVMARNNGELPSFALLGSGAATVSNTYGFDAKTNWNSIGFIGEPLTFTGKHNPSPQWTIDPVADRILLQGMKAACVWMVCGGSIDASQTDILNGPTVDEVYDTLILNSNNSAAKHILASKPRPHFGVLEDLQKIGFCWFGRGSRREMPRCVRYYGEHCGTYVWVTDEGMAGLSEFTLILEDIATRSTTSLKAKPVTVSIEFIVCSTPAEQGHPATNKTTKTIDWKVAQVIDKSSPDKVRYAALGGIQNGMGMAYFLPSPNDQCDPKIDSLLYEDETPQKPFRANLHAIESTESDGSFTPERDLPRATGYRRN